MQTWLNCISSSRAGKKSGDINRTHYQRDYDRIIFSSSFRRLQNKTQVFPLPGNTFVHNRLTHSLEVASVGRSLGAIAGEYIASNVKKQASESILNFYNYDLSSVVAAACLAHDVGNPPFGHSGEKAISSFFDQYSEYNIGGQKLRELFTDTQWAELSNFEGNANAFHILTYPYTGKFEAGMQLTFTTLATLIKYPCEASAVNKKHIHTKKYGFFEIDKDRFIDVAEHTNMLKVQDQLLCYKRHPFVYLVEAADDICYRIIDFEDAQRIGIIDKSIVKNLFIETIGELTKDSKSVNKINSNLKIIKDENETIAYLRAKCIGALITKCADTFIDANTAILSGDFNQSLLDQVEQEVPLLKEINNISVQKIYDHSSVINVEIAGYKVLSEIMSTFITALLTVNKTPLQKKTLQLIPSQFRIESAKSDYEKVLNIIDYIAGMTDGYATELYRNFQGIEIAKHG